MSFLNPNALWLSLLAIPLVVLYALRVRPPRVAVATTMFWEPSQRQKALWSVSYRLRDIVSLVLQLALLALLLTALAEPRWGASETDSRLVVIVLDNSASMSATDVRPSRFDAAKHQAMRLIDRLSGEDQAAIVTAAGEPRLACRKTRLRSLLRQAIEGTTPSHAPGRIDEAISLASHVPGRGERHLVVISDRSVPVKRDRSFDQVELLSVGTAADNVAITRFQARRNYNDPVGYQVLVEVSNISRHSEKCRLEVSLDGQMIDVFPLELAPGEVWHRVIDETSALGGRLAARIDVDDALAVDNEAWSILPERSVRTVYLAGPDNVFLQQAFEALPQVDLRYVDELPSQVERNAVLVLNRHPIQELPAGSVLIIEPVDSIAEWECGDLIDVSYGTARTESDLLRYVRPDDVAFHNVRMLELLVPAAVAMRSLDDQPLLFTIPRERGDVVVFNFGVEKGDLPLRTAFPILVSNVLDRLTHSSGEMIDSLNTGEFARVAPEDLNLSPQVMVGLDESADPLAAEAVGESSLRDPQEVSAWLHAPSGIRRKQVVSPRNPLIGPLDECGVWKLEIPALSKNAEAGSIEIACNLCNQEVSHLLVDESELPARSSLHGPDWRAGWGTIVVAAIILSLAEWALYHRRWIQ